MFAAARRTARCDGSRLPCRRLPLRAPGRGRRRRAAFPGAPRPVSAPALARARRPAATTARDSARATAGARQLGAPTPRRRRSPGDLGRSPRRRRRAAEHPTPCPLRGFRRASLFALALRGRGGARGAPGAVAVRPRPALGSFAVPALRPHAGASAMTPIAPNSARAPDGRADWPRLRGVRRVIRQIHARFPGARPRSSMPTVFAEGVSSWLDPYGLWSAGSEARLARSFSPTPSACSPSLGNSPATAAKARATSALRS